MDLVLLKTDFLVYLVLACIFSFAFYSKGREHLSAPWKQVLRSKVAMVSMVVLFFYLLVALADSVHFRESVGLDNNNEQQYSVEVLSILDVVLNTPRTQVEKTYSSPFATHQFSMETLERPDGTQYRGFPRLIYGGAHLTNLKDRTGDILATVVSSALIGLSVWGGVVVLFLILLSRKNRLPVAEMLKRVMNQHCPYPWHVFLFSIGVVLILFSVALSLSADYHIFGTDKVGQDVFYQTLKSIRTALIIGTLTTLVMLPFAVILGTMAGYFSGWIDDLIQYIYTTLSSIPGVLLIASSVLMLQVYIDTNPESFATDADRADMRLLFLCIILGVTSWTGLCRLLRGETLKLKRIDFIQASSAFGVKSSKIISKHLIPNVMHIILIAVVLDFSGLVLAEAVLSYLGVGVDPSMNSWGNMINRARLEMAREPIVWWSLLAAFSFMLVLVLAANLFSDKVRDAFDPKLRKG